MKSGPRLPQLEKALAQKRRPNTAKKKERKKEAFIKKKKRPLPSKGLKKKKIFIDFINPPRVEICIYCVIETQNDIPSLSEPFFPQQKLLNNVAFSK